MNSSPDSGVFGVTKTIEQMPFADISGKTFFSKWCAVNDSIIPQYCSRMKWNQRMSEGKSILEPIDEGRKELWVPEDLRLWEIVAVVEAVDADTFLRHPKRAIEKAESLGELSRMFTNTGIYIAQRLDAIDSGKTLATCLAKEFYSYGNALRTGEKTLINPEIKMIASHSLSEEELDLCDRWLAGDKLYQSRMARVELLGKYDPDNSNDFKEKERRHTLSQFFNISQRALEKMSLLSSADAFTETMTKRIAGAIEKPIDELNFAIFQRGIEKMATEMMENRFNIKNGVVQFLHLIGIDVPNNQKTLAEKIGISYIKAEIEKARTEGNVNMISDMELAAGKKIQKAVSGFGYSNEGEGYFPSLIVKNQRLNCLGFSALGSALLSEAGIPQLILRISHGHTMNIIVTSNGKPYLLDMQGGAIKEIQNHDLAGNKTDGTSINIDDIVEIANSTKLDSLIIGLSRKITGHSLSGYRHLITSSISKPENELQKGILQGMVDIIRENKNQVREISAEKIKSRKLIKDICNYWIKIDPQSSYVHKVLGETFENEGRMHMAIKEYRKAAQLDPIYAGIHESLGNVYSGIKQYKEAIWEYQAFLKLTHPIIDLKSVIAVKAKIARFTQLPQEQGI